MKKASLFFILLAALCFSSCQRNAEQASPHPAEEGRQGSPASAAAPIIFSILPAESAGAMYERFLPLKYQLEKTLNVPVVIRIAKDYETAMQEIGSGQAHITCLDPATYCEARARYGKNVIPLVRTIRREGELSRSVLIAKQGGAVEKIIQAKGKRLVLGNRQSSFGYLIPLAMLQDVGIGIKDFASVDYVQQEDGVALSVLIGNHDVGALSEAVAKKFLADGLVIVKASEAIPQYVLCASHRVPQKTREVIINGLVSPSPTHGVPAAEQELGGFVAAEDRDFDAVRVMMGNLTGRDYIEYGPKTIKVAVLPLYSAITLFERYDPLMRYLSRKTGYEFKLVIPRDFDDFIEVVKSGVVDFSYQNPYVFSLIDRDVGLRPLVTTIGEDLGSADGGGDRFRGVIITRRDSAITDINGLRRKKVLVVSPKSAGGFLSQKLSLFKAGIDVEQDLRIVDAKRQENVILGVYRGEADAGFVRESALDVLQDEIDMHQIRVLARTQPLPNWPFSQIRKGNQALGTTVARLLAELQDREILAAAQVKGFKAAVEADFEVLRRY